MRALLSLPTTLCALVGFTLAAEVEGQTALTRRVVVGSNGTQSNGDSRVPSISADGRWVAFSSSASNLVAGDTNVVSDVFIYDRLLGQTQCISLSTSSSPGNAESGGVNGALAVSRDGRYVAFTSSASNLIAADTNAGQDVFLRDRTAGSTTRVSVRSNGTEAGGGSAYSVAMTPDARYVVFTSTSPDLVSGDLNGRPDIFVHDNQTGSTQRVNVSSVGVEANQFSDGGSISDDGRYIVFYSTATNLVSGDTNNREDVFLCDRMTGTTSLVSRAPGGALGNEDSLLCSISHDGQYVSFVSFASNLVSGDTNAASDVFVLSLATGVSERVSVDSSGNQGNSGIAGLFESPPYLTPDDRYVVFSTKASNLASGDSNTQADVFLHDRLTGLTECISLVPAGVTGNGISNFVSISDDARFVAFRSAASNLVFGDTNSTQDCFVRDRRATGFESQCFAGTSGTMACPCANPPGGSGAGCDNSSATGGAILAAAGAAYVSADSLVFTTSGENPIATSILLQGDLPDATGSVFGQGVRCMSGSLKHLFTKIASSGSIVAPGSGDASISARSAALGDPIQGGQTRWYVVYYRDPIVLGGCPGASTFNVTQTGRVEWSL